MISYSTRISYFTKETHFFLDSEAVRIEQKDTAAKIILYKNITSIRISYMPDRMRNNNYRCNFTAGKEEHIFQSSIFVSLANFRDDPAGYKNFLTAFIQKVYAANPAVRLLSGRPKAAYRGSVFLMLLSMAALAVALYFLGEYFSPVSWLKFVLVLLLIPMALSYIQKNKPGTFTAYDIPVNLLPKD